MTAATESASRPGVVDRWLRFVFTPADPAPMALLRIVAGVLAFGWAVSYLPDAGFFLSGHGAQTGLPDAFGRGEWTASIGNPTVALLLLALFSLAMTAGAASRLTSILVLVGLIAISRRDYLTLNSGDLLLRCLVFYVVLMPSGECWSVDAWLRRRFRGREPVWRAPWGLRLLQVQVSLIYFFAVWDKLRGQSWADGTAVGRALQIEDLQRFAVPFDMTTNPAIAALLTYGTLAAEIFLVFGLWVPRTRYWAMAVGVLLHLGIDATILVGWFSLTTIACYLAFVPGEDLRRALAWVRAPVVHTPVTDEGVGDGEEVQRVDQQ